MALDEPDEAIEPLRCPTGRQLHGQPVGQKHRVLRMTSQALGEDRLRRGVAGDGDEKLIPDTRGLVEHLIVGVDDDRGRRRPEGEDETLYIRQRSRPRHSGGDEGGDAHAEVFREGIQSASQDCIALLEPAAEPQERDRVHRQPGVDWQELVWVQLLGKLLHLLGTLTCQSERQRAQYTETAP
ncbi:MAG: hypothetical protein LC733_05690 [Actinobacteria bacterium]|nr:hypothetical protein [Actinomycetota bacterium]